MPENNLFDIKKRIKAAAQTRKITGTMELIASSRLHRGRLMLASCQEWADYMRQMVRCLPDDYFAPLDGAADGKAFIVFGGSRGLSGSYGSNLLAYAAPIAAGHPVIAVGSATAAFFPDAYRCFDDEAPSAAVAGAIAKAAKTLWESKGANEVYIIYMRGTKLLSERLFPLVRTAAYKGSVIIEPSKKVLFPVLFDEYIVTVVYEACLHAFVAEQMARVSAMDSATQNADEIIENLKSKYNRIRQSDITQEIIMVSNAARGGGS